jgi:tetratricopeptide (TPR) repeat protein
VSVVLLALLVAAHPAASDAGEAGGPTVPGRPAPTAAPKTEQAPPWKKLLDEGKTLFEAGRHAEAIEVLHRAFLEKPDSMDINWFLGRAAFESGDFETAVMAFERILVLEPEASRARLELARSYYGLGLRELSKQEFETVLKSSPPDAVKDNIRRFLAQMDGPTRRQFLSVSLSVTGNWDSNARVSPGDDTVKTAVGDVVLGDDSTRASDFFHTETVSLVHKLRLGETAFHLKSMGVGHMAWYRDEDEQNILFGKGSIGLAWEDKLNALDFSFGYSHVTKDHLELVNVREFSLSGTRIFARNFIGNAAVSHSIKRYENPVSYKDADNDSVSVRALLGWRKLRLTPSAGYEVEDSVRDTESYVGLNAGLGLQHELLWGVMGSAGYGFRVSDYEEEEPLFGKRRHDEVHDFSVGLSRKFGKYTTVHASHVWTEACSSIELYEYDRRLLTVGATIAF